MEAKYDLIVIGAGPAGLTIAQCAASVNKTVLIIEKEDTIGGCHKVHRIKEPSTDQMLFSEHGPRVYSDAFTNFKMVLENMNLNFNDLFTRYDFNFSTVGGISASKLQAYEILFFIIEFSKLLVNKRHGEKISVLEFAESNKFTPETMSYLDAMCRLTDGASIKNYSLNQFLMLIDQQALYSLYQPRKPNDTGLLTAWQEHIEGLGVKFLLNTKVTTIENDSTQIISVNKEYFAENYIFAIPPESLLKIPMKYFFGDPETLKAYSKATEYIDYTSIIHHWDTVVPIPKIWGFPKNEWGVGFIILTDYMTFEETLSKTVVSMVITKTDVKSGKTGKTAEESTEEEKINEVLRQSDLTLPPPTISFVYPLQEEAYVRNIHAVDDMFPFQSKYMSNLFTLGTHNNFSDYHFTSIESAVTNAIVLAHNLYPDTIKSFQYSSGRRVTNLIKIIGMLVIIIIIMYYFIL